MSSNCGKEVLILVVVDDGLVPEHAVFLSKYDCMS